MILGGLFIVCWYWGRKNYIGIAIGCLIILFGILATEDVINRIIDYLLLLKEKLKVKLMPSAEKMGNVLKIVKELFVNVSNTIKDLFSRVFNRFS